MAFIRWKVNKYGLRQAYLVHSYRDDQGRPRQKTLAYLGDKGEIGDEKIQSLQQQHSALKIDWTAIKPVAHPEPVTNVDQLSDIELSQKIRDLRKEHGLSQQAMADKLVALGAPPLTLYREAEPFSSGVYVSLERGWTNERCPSYRQVLPVIAPYIRQILKRSAS